jgi:hypothetical protein
LNLQGALKNYENAWLDVLNAASDEFEQQWNAREEDETVDDIVESILDQVVYVDEDSMDELEEAIRDRAFEMGVSDDV